MPDAAERLARVRAAGLQKGLGGSMLSAVAAWDWALRGGTAQECSELALAVLADGWLITLDAGFMALVAARVLVVADRDEALAVCEAALSAAHQMGSLIGVSSVNVWRGWTWLARGELAEAEAALREGLEGIRLMEEQNGAGMAYAAGFLARVLIERGDLDGARAALMSCPQPTPGSDGEAVVRRTTVELLLEEGDWTRALAEAELHRERLGDVDNVAWAPWRSLTARALDGLERRDEARALLEEELVKARHWGAPGSLARTLRLLGAIRQEDGLDLLHEAVDTADGSPARLEHAKALTALGSALRLARKPSDARAPLRDAFEIASHCGAQPLAEHARNELYAAGGRPRRQALTGPDSLTPSERRVAADGGRRPEQPRHRPRALRDPEDGRGPSDERVPQAGDPAPRQSCQRSLDAARGSRPGHWGHVRGFATMCGPARQRMLCLMSVEIRHIAIDVLLDGDEISGRAGDGTDQPRAFQGWLGLLAALDALLGKTDEEPAALR